MFERTGIRALRAATVSHPVTRRFASLVDPVGDSAGTGGFLDVADLDLDVDPLRAAFRRVLLHEHGRALQRSLDQGLLAQQEGVHLRSVVSLDAFALAAVGVALAAVSLALTATFGGRGGRVVRGRSGVALLLGSSGEGPLWLGLEIWIW